jgi:hypothetical protein
MRYNAHSIAALTRYTTVGGVCITNAKSITNEDYGAIFTVLKQNFRLFSFCLLNFAQFAIINKKKKSLKKVCFSGEKFCSKIFFFFFFFHRRFLSAVFFGGGHFSPNLKPYSIRSLSTLHCFQKSGGVMWRLF